jgi:hypothetical protein
VPSCRTASSLIGVGVRSITVDPTASTGDAAGTVSAAARWPAARAKTVARTPYAACHTRWRAVIRSEICMSRVRSRGTVRMGRPGSPVSNGWGSAAGRTVCHWTTEGAGGVRQDDGHD